MPDMLTALERRLTDQIEHLIGEHARKIEEFEGRISALTEESRREQRRISRLTSFLASLLPEFEAHLPRD